MTTALQATDTSASVEVASRLFGPLTVSTDEFITFPDGLPGFAGERRFVLLPAAPEGYFWLQSVEEGSLAFLLLDPFVTFPGYTVELPDGETEGGPMVLAIATLPRAAGESWTANLQAPVVLDLERRQGRQFIMPEAAYGPRHAFQPAAPAA
jgi:flagellar assembly factor FliW